MTKSSNTAAASRRLARTAEVPVLQVVVAGRKAADREWLAELLRSGSSRRLYCQMCGSGAEVLRVVRPTRRGKPRVLLAAPVDDIDPLQLLERLAPAGAQAPCPVVVVTPGVGRDIGPALLRAGAQDYLGESWLSPQGLARAVDNALVRWTLERELREVDEALKASLRQSDARKDVFIATLAHELRNPLAPLRNGLEILRRGGELTGSAAGARDMMERQLHHLVRLVDDLMDASRINCGKVRLRRERITLQAVVEHALEASRPGIDAAAHALTVKLPPAPVWIDGDLTRLAQVLSNLLNNAAKYTSPGGRIALDTWADAAEAVLRVSDNGAGIAADMLPRVFDLFAQADGTLPRSQGGLGIGLSLARQLLELHGGSIQAESAGPGRGSCFTARLPLAGASTGVREGIPAATRSGQANC